MAKTLLAVTFTIISVNFIEYLEAVQFQLVFRGQPHFDDEVSDVVSLVSLKLDHLAVLWVINNRPVTGKFLGQGQLERCEA